MVVFEVLTESLSIQHLVAHYKLLLLLLVLFCNEIVNKSYE